MREEQPSQTYHRKVIRIRAEDSPNVRLALEQQRRGLPVTNEELVPGLIRWEAGDKGYCFRRQHWDKEKQSVSLDALFWEGQSQKLYPSVWLAKAIRFYGERPSFKTGGLDMGRWMGVDPAEGGDSSCWTVIDKLGIIKQLSLKTPDTTEVVERTLWLMREEDVPADHVWFDRGGGGKQHADRLREMGHGVMMVAFGEAVALEPRRGLTLVEERLRLRDSKQAFVNRRAEMYWMLRELLDPTSERAKAGLGFAIPPECGELLRQLGLIPLLYDREGRFKMLSKGASEDGGNNLVKLLGHSPDEADSLVLAVYGMRYRRLQAVAGPAI